MAGVSGGGREIKLSLTILVDEDGVEIFIPNRKIVGEIIHNSQAYHLVEAAVDISYDDPQQAVDA